MSLLSGRRNQIIAGTVVAAIAAAAVVAVILVSTHRSPGPTAPVVSPEGGCPSSGCALVSSSVSLPPVTVFYGGSCSGLQGSWFFNAVEGGGNDQLRPSYALQWTFASGSSMAKPSGRISISSTATTDVTATLLNGVLTIKGTRKPKTQVSASGSLEVALSGTSGAPTLTFTESGLRQAESSLGLVSPFDAGGQPLVVPIKMVRTMSGC